MQMESIWRDLSKPQQISAAIGVLVLLMMLAASSIFVVSKEEYSVLFADLQEKDAAAVLEALEKEKINYSLSETGTEILVPTKEVHRTRLKLMGSDVPINGGVGFEIFNDSSFGTTEFAQKVNFQRALQGELTRTIMSLKEVKYARVHLVMPENGLFKREGQEASASVTLFLKNGMRLDQQQIAGIQRLISASVPKLDPESVIIVDQSGDVLSESPVSEEIGLIQGELAQKRTLEQYLKSKATEVLSKAFELQEFAVSVDVTLDFNESTVTTEDILPQDQKTKQGLLKSKELISPADTDNAAPHRITREEEYVVGRSVSKTIQRPGKIKKISAGVWLPESVSDSVVKEVGQLVAMSVGIDRGRGDDLVVSAVLKQAQQISPASPALVSDNPTPAENDSDIAVRPAPLWEPGMELKYWILAGAVLVASLMAILFRKSAIQRKQDLTRQEREQLLLTLHTWMNAENKRDNIVEL